MDAQVLQAIQDYISYVAANSSALRNAGAKGVVSAAQTYLRQLRLEDFGVQSEPEFRSVLDRHTDRLRCTFPPRARDNWGASRKVLNIFLRDALYHRLLCEHYRLYQLESWLEVPLDEHVASHLKKHSTPELSWFGICRVTLELNAAYQKRAGEAAGEKPRIWCDYFWWRNQLRSKE